MFDVLSSVCAVHICLSPGRRESRLERQRGFYGTDTVHRGVVCHRIGLGSVLAPLEGRSTRALRGMSCHCHLSTHTQRSECVRGVETVRLHKLSVDAPRTTAGRPRRVWIIFRHFRFRFPFRSREDPVFLFFFLHFPFRFGDEHEDLEVGRGTRHAPWRACVGGLLDVAPRYYIDY